MGRLGWSANCGCRPLSLITSADMADVLFVAHRYEESIQQSRKAFDMDPNFAIARFELGQVLAQRKCTRKRSRNFKKQWSFLGVARPAFRPRLPIAPCPAGERKRLTHERFEQSIRIVAFLMLPTSPSCRPV
jgi:hypothetical protein